MPTIKQLRANRQNAKKSTGPTSPEGKQRVRFNALVHGLRAQSAVIPGEDQATFDQLLERLSAAWHPQDDMERSLVEQIAVNQWKLARIDRHEARIYEPDALTPGELALAIHRLNLTQGRLERSISRTIADLERYRKERIERKKDTESKAGEKYQPGLIVRTSDGARSYDVLPRVLGLDGVWREIPREVLGDFPPPPPPDPA